MPIDEKAFAIAYTARQGNDPEFTVRDIIEAYEAAKEQPATVTYLGSVSDQPDECALLAFAQEIAEKSPDSILGKKAATAIKATHVREIVSPPPEMGMRMADVRVGMCLKSLYGGPVVTVTEITEKGFKYNHPPYSLGPRFGSTEGGEHYGYNGYSHYTLVVSKEQGRWGSDGL